MGNNALWSFLALRVPPYLEVKDSTLLLARDMKLHFMLCRICFTNGTEEIVSHLFTLMKYFYILFLFCLPVTKDNQGPFRFFLLNAFSIRAIKNNASFLRDFWPLSVSKRRHFLNFRLSKCSNQPEYRCIIQGALKTESLVWKRTHLRTIATTFWFLLLRSDINRSSLLIFYCDLFFS